MISETEVHLLANSARAAVQRRCADLPSVSSAISIDIIIIPAAIVLRGLFFVPPARRRALAFHQVRCTMQFPTYCSYIIAGCFHARACGTPALDEQPLSLLT